jgi:ADP-ribosylglycohydrolase
MTGVGVHQRIVAALEGIATGDAIGKQTETLSREGVRQWHPDGVHGFEGRPGTVIPRYSGNRRREWLIGETTDDTEGTIAVARAILQDGDANHTSIGRQLLGCRKSVHPGVASLWEFHQAGDAARVTDRHDGCGASIRVAPVGLLYSSTRLDDIVAAAREASIPTHGGALALAAAAATAAAVSAAVDGRSSVEIFEVAERAAMRAEAERSPTDDGTFARAMRDVRRELSEWGALQPDYIASVCHPVTPLTIVPLAIALATTADSAEDAILLAANVGGDADSVASIAGGILAARRPDTVNKDWVAVVEQVNGHDLIGIADGLARLRR